MTLLQTVLFSKNGMEGISERKLKDFQDAKLKRPQYLGID